MNNITGSLPEASSVSNEPDATNSPKHDPYMEAHHKMMHIARKVLDDHKAENMAVIDFDGANSMAESLIIASGRSSRHVKSLARRVKEAFKKEKNPVSVEGMERGDWVLIDAGSLILHLFQPAVRDYYDLEGMLSDLQSTKQEV